MKTLLHAIALAACLAANMQIAGEHMDGTRRAVETIAKANEKAQPGCPDCAIMA